jgi:hypothetical protein
MAGLVFTEEMLHKLKQIEFDVTDAKDLRMGFEYEERTLTPVKLTVFFEQYDTDPVVATKIRVNGPVRKLRGEGYLKNTEGEVDYGAYWLTKDKVRTRMEERKAPLWVLGQLLTIWPDSL